MAAESIPYDLTDRIMELIARGNGIRLSGIEEKLDGIASRRTLSRRLDALVRERRIDRLGRSRAALYRLRDGRRVFPAEPRVDALGEPSVPYDATEFPFSGEALLIREEVNADLSLRSKVGYRHALLKDYRPNATFYLSQTERRLLASYDVLYGAALPEGSYGRALVQHLLIDLSWSSSHLEGNTYNRRETQQLIEQGIAAENKTPEELRMILNHKEAIEFILGTSPDIGINAYTLMNLHALLSDDLMRRRDCGRLRTGAVFISRSAYTPLAEAREIEEMFTVLTAKAAAIHDPFEQAFFLLVHVPYLQPFWDVNKRVSRLAANIPLIRSQKCPLSFVDVSQRTYLDAMLAVYELNRLELLKELFVWAYHRSCRDYQNLNAGTQPTNPLRLKYRAALREVVGAIVREGEFPDAGTIERRAGPLVEPADLKPFVELALGEFAILQEGNIALYRIPLAGYRRWRQTHRS